MFRNLQAIIALLLGIFFFYGANGLLTTVLALKSQLAGFERGLIGLLASGYYLGFILACMSGKNLIARFRTYQGLRRFRQPGDHQRAVTSPDRRTDYLDIAQGTKRLLPCHPDHCHRDLVKLRDTGSSSGFRFLCLSYR